MRTARPLLQVLAGEPPAFPKAFVDSLFKPYISSVKTYFRYAYGGTWHCAVFGSTIYDAQRYKNDYEIYSHFPHESKQNAGKNRLPRLKKNIDFVTTSKSIYYIFS